MDTYVPLAMRGLELIRTDAAEMTAPHRTGLQRLEIFDQIERSGLPVNIDELLDAFNYLKC